MQRIRKGLLCTAVLSGVVGGLLACSPSKKVKLELVLPASGLHLSIDKGFTPIGQTPEKLVVNHGNVLDRMAIVPEGPINAAIEGIAAELEERGYSRQAPIHANADVPLYTVFMHSETEGRSVFIETWDFSRLRGNNRKTWIEESGNAAYLRENPKGLKIVLYGAPAKANTESTP
ncbi:hypothetical protein IT575_08465 [bacterium]|nr:hypothetical protein [bacterium]